MSLPIDNEYLAYLDSITAKRPKTVIQHILKHGQITTEELKEIYGYDHPPRAARDVREVGVPLKTLRVPGKTGRMIAAYTLDLDTKPTEQRSAGRRAFPKAFKEALAISMGERCRVCGLVAPLRSLQVDHRIPYEIAGDTDIPNLDECMLLCPSCNRSKSWSCEHCPNWTLRVSETCQNCMWASPETYQHIATERRYQVVINWNEDNWGNLESLQRQADSFGIDVEALIARLIGWHE